MDKKHVNKDFDVIIGSFEGTKICELVGLYILHISGEKQGKEIIGLNRDDCLAWFDNIIRPQAHQATKNSINLFKNGFLPNIVCNTNLKFKFS